MALYAVAIAMALGSAQVDYLDQDDERLRITRALGGNPLDIRTVPSSRGIHHRGRERLIPGLGRGFKIFGAGWDLHQHWRLLLGTRDMPLFHMYTTWVRFYTGFANVRLVIPEVLNLVAREVLRPELITTLQADWHDARQAFAERTTKVVIVRR